MSQKLVRGLFIPFLALVFLIAPAAAVAADGRIVDNGDGTVTDTGTGLMWARTDNMGHITWHDARLYCENFLLGGYDNWRMPTIEELKTLFDDSSKGHETICGQKVRARPFIELSCGFVWSSEVRSESDQYPISALAYNFSKGYWFSSRMSQYRGYRALPVRTIGE